MANEPINTAINRVTQDAMELFFPTKCPFCGCIIGRKTECAVCKDDLPLCGQLITGPGFGAVAAPLWYDGRVRDAILAFKFRAKLGGMRTFGAMMAQTAAEHYSGQFDTITWVPVSKKRLRKRGFDQSRYLTAALCVDWHTEPVEMLRKTVDNPAQSGLEDHAQRQANVLGVYEVVNKDQIAGRRILLVDDIFTTGATLSEAVRVLKEAGAAEVMCLTLAITPDHHA